MSKRILIVEDESVVAADIAGCLAGMGYEVAGAAATGPEALRIAAGAPPDLVLMDIKLKGVLDGIDVAGTLYDQFKVPVVYLTAHADEETLTRARQTAPSGYVLKPFDERTLRTAIELAFDRHCRDRQLMENGQRLAAAIGSIDEAVIVTQENGRVTFLNRLAEKLTGWMQDEAAGKPVSEIFVILNGRTGVPQPSPISRVLREGTAVGLGNASGDDVVLVGRQGSREIIYGSAAPMQAGEFQPAGVCLLFRAAGQRSADESWCSPEHRSANRLQVLGRILSLAASQPARSAELAERLMEFAAPKLRAPSKMDLNQIVTGCRDLIECALDGHQSLRIDLWPRNLPVKAESGSLEMILLHLALETSDAEPGGVFAIRNTGFESPDTGEAYAVLRVAAPGVRHELPVLDEIVCHSSGEIRFSIDAEAVSIYLPAAE